MTPCIVGPTHSKEVCRVTVFMSVLTEFVLITKREGYMTACPLSSSHHQIEALFLAVHESISGLPVNRLHHHFESISRMYELVINICNSQTRGNTYVEFHIRGVLVQP